MANYTLLIKKNTYSWLVHLIYPPAIKAGNCKSLYIYINGGAFYRWDNHQWWNFKQTMFHYRIFHVHIERLKIPLSHLIILVG